jgi:hypothetical protein
MKVRRSYKYRLYRCDKWDKHLRAQIKIAGTIWNHALALQKCCYRLTKKYIPLARMKAHIARLRMHMQRYTLRIARTHIRIADRRRDEQYKLAHALCDCYDLLCFEDLNLNAMKRLWGRKVSDLAFGQCMTILKHVAHKRNKIVKQIGRFERTTGKCSACGHLQTLTLRQRAFQCQCCGLTLDRDHNAAINILHVGASANTPIDAVRPLLAGAASSNGRSSSL